MEKTALLEPELVLTAEPRARKSLWLGWGRALERVRSRARAGLVTEDLPLDRALDAAHLSAALAGRRRHADVSRVDFPWDPFDLHFLG